MTTPAVISAQPRTWRRRVHDHVTAHHLNQRPNAWAWIIMLALLTNLTVTVLESVPELYDRVHLWEPLVSWCCGLCFLLDWLARLWSCPDHVDDHGRAISLRPRTDYQLSFLGLMDLVAALPVVYSLTGEPSQIWFDLVAVFSLFKFSRYVPALELVGSVVRNERRPLMAALSTLALLLTINATCMFLVERAAQPEIFKSIPHTLWWGIVTMTTTGYGDMAPVTLLGRLLGGVAMIIGVGMLAIPAGIVATGFSNELQRRELLSTWRLVSRMPLFATLDASRIADIAGMLRRQIIPAGSEIVRRGQFSDSMYFIVQGEVEVEITPHPVRLRAGQFFGEAGLIDNKPRNATVSTVTTTQFLVLGLSQFHDLMERQPDVREKIQAVMDQRRAPT
jgi:voltage-gated potassium channel